MRKFSSITNMVSAAAIAGAMSVTTLAVTSTPAAAQIHAGVGIGPLGVGVNLGARDHDRDGYWRDGYWHPYRDRVIEHDYGYPVGYAYDPNFPYGYYGADGYSCADPYSPYYDTSFCE